MISEVQKRMCSGYFVTYLPDTDNGVGDEDEEDDEGLHEGSDRLITILKEGQNLEEKDGWMRNNLKFIRR